MSAISSVLAPLAHLNIFKGAYPTFVDVKGWIGNQDYFIDDEIRADAFKMRVANPSYIASAFGNDCNRMAMAAIETISGVTRDQNLRESGAWPTIRSYYSAFFSAHAILRIFGVSCSQLESDHVNKIFESATLFGCANGIKKLERGFYAIKVDRKFEFVEFKKYKDSHRDTWEAFLQLINILIEQSGRANALAEHRLETVDILRKIKSGICSDSCTEKGNWLSKIRNSVNYQHSYGVWFPHDKRSSGSKHIDKISSEWIKSISANSIVDSGTEMEIFYSLCSAINSLLRELLISCSGKFAPASPAFKNGSLFLLKKLKAHQVE
jgi:hypothetical protein